MLTRILSILTGSCVLSLSGCQHQANQPNLPSQAIQRIDEAAIRLHTDNAFGKLVSIRRDLHTHPELAGNEVRTAAAIATRLREIGLEVQTGPYGHSVVGILRGGQPGKTVVWRAELDALPGFYPDPDLYETNASNLAGIPARIERTIDASGHKAKLISVSYVQANPTVLNDEKLTQQTVRTLQSTVGGENVKLLYGQAPFFNDDFAYFQQRIPGVYFFLGGSNFEKGMIAMNHAPNFRVDEESIRFGVRSFSTLMLARLGVPLASAASN